MQLGEEVLQQLLDLGTDVHDVPAARIVISACGMCNAKGAPAAAHLRTVSSTANSGTIVQVVGAAFKHNTAEGPTLARSGSSLQWMLAGRVAGVVETDGEEAAAAQRRKETPEETAARLATESKAAQDSTR